MVMQNYIYLFAQISENKKEEFELDVSAIENKERQTKPDCRDMAVQNSPDCQEVAVQTSPDCQEVAVQNSPDCQEVAVQYSSDRQEVAVQYSQEVAVQTPSEATAAGRTTALLFAEILS